MVQRFQQSRFRAWCMHAPERIGSMALNVIINRVG